jgi:hypothetical protein
MVRFLSLVTDQFSTAWVAHWVVEIWYAIVRM